MVNHSQITKYFHEYNDRPAKRKYYKQYKYKRVNVKLAETKHGLKLKD